MAEPDYNADMKLPNGRTCANCYAVRFCVGIGCTKAENTSCDYWPNRFSPRQPTSTDLDAGLLAAQQAAEKRGDT